MRSCHVEECKEVRKLYVEVHVFQYCYSTTDYFLLCLQEDIPEFVRDKEVH